VTEGSPTVRRRRLGLALRNLREGAGITGDAAAKALERSASWISRIEAGHVRLRTRDLHDLFDLYGLENHERRAELETWAREGQARGWWSRYREAIPEAYARYIGLEDEAEEIFVFDNVLVPGLLQTEEYAEAVNMRTIPAPPPEAGEIRVKVRMLRQRVLLKEPPLRMIVVLDQAVLHRSYGGHTILRGQLQRLLEAGKLPSVKIRIMPFDQSDQVLTGSFTILRFAYEPDAVYLETATGSVNLHGSEVQEYQYASARILATALDEAESLSVVGMALEKLN
jgi:transcriptional regulator with XRE-family HTH domain